MSRQKFRFVSFLVPLFILFLSVDVHAEDVMDKLMGDFSNHPALQVENFQVEIKDFKQGFLSLYVPSRPENRDWSDRKMWKELMEKAESLALKYPEVRDVTWFEKIDGGSGDSLYVKPSFFSNNWTAHFHFGGGRLSWPGDNSWDGSSSEEIFVSNVDFGKTDWPFLLHSSSKNSTARYSLIGGSGDRYRINESSFGIRKYFPMSSITPYLSGGLSQITIRAENGDIFSGNDYYMDSTVTSTNAFYLNAGIVKKIGKYFEGGIDIRSVQAGTATVELIENDMSNSAASIFLGWGF